MPDDQIPSPPPGPNAGVEELQADIEQTRAELGETLGALSEKVDVKAQARRRAELAKDAVEQQARHVNEKANEHRGLLLAVAAAAIAAIGLVVWRRRR